MALSVDISKRLGEFQLRVQFETEGEILALLGASGCGKSMTLKCIAGIETPDSGRIVLNGRTLFDSEKHINLSVQKRRVGYLFQQYALFPNMSVEQNILAGTKRLPKEQRAALVREKIAAFGLQGLEKKRPAQLSGGQQQRVALARILVSQPEVLLLDEPFSALDSHLKWQLELELADTLAAFGGETIFVSHSRDEVYRLCNTVCVLDRGHAEPKLAVKTMFHTPQTVTAARLSGCKNISALRRVDAHTAVLTDWGVTVHTEQPVDDTITHAGVRAHYMRFAQPGDENTVLCQVDRVIDNVFSTILMLRTPAGGAHHQQLRMELEKEQWEPRKDSTELTLCLPAESIMLLAGEA